MLPRPLAHRESNFEGYQALTADTAEEIQIPDRASFARLTLSNESRYALGISTNTSRGFLLGAGTHDITVAGDKSLSLISLNTSGTVYIEFFGGDQASNPIRAGSHLHASIAGQTAYGLKQNNFPNGTTHVLFQSNRAGNMAVREQPSLSKGIPYTQNQIVRVPTKDGDVRIFPHSAGITEVQAQFYVTDRYSILPWNVKYDSILSRVVKTYHVQFSNANVVNVDVPATAKWAWLGKGTGDGFKYATNGISPTSTQRGFSVAGAGVKVPVQAGTNNLKLIRAGSNSPSAYVVFYG